MHNHKKIDRFYLYVIISLIFHTVLFLLFPFAGLTIPGDELAEREFAFMQVVEYQVDSQTTEPVKKIDKPVPEAKPEPKPVPAPKPKAEPKPKPEPVVEQVKKPEPLPVPKAKEEPQPQPISQPKPEVVNENNSAVMTSENSPLEIEVNESKTENKAVEPVPEREIEPAEIMPPAPPKAGEKGAPIPNYPKDLVSQQLVGKVELRVFVDSSGQVAKTEIISSSGIEQMDRTAQLTLERGWKFKEFQQAYSLTILIDYKFDDNGNPLVDVKAGEITF